MALEKAKDVVASNTVVVFSKSYCPFCKKVKQLLESLGVKMKVVELDQESDGPAVQAALAQWTGQRTVPNVFIGGQHIGGCDSKNPWNTLLFFPSLQQSFDAFGTFAKHDEGKLVPLLQEAKALEAQKIAT